MRLMSPNSMKEAIASITKSLNFNETYMAGFLGVTVKTIDDWKKREMGDLPPKARRLVRLYEVIHYLQDRHKEIPESSYKNLIENGRITIDPSDPEDGSTTLISFILAEPAAKIWAPCVDEVVNEFQKSNQKKAEKLRGDNPSVRYA